MKATIWKTVTLALLATLSTAAHANNDQIEVQKADGNIARYRLLPVHFDPNHEEVVQERLARMSLTSSTAPSSYQIPATQLPPIRDQGSRGTCAYFATVGILEAHYGVTTDATKISEECLVDVRNWEYDTSTYTGADKPSDRPDPNGDLPDSIIKTVNNYGVPASGTYGQTSCVYDGDNQNGGSVSLTDYQAATAKSSAYGKTVVFNENTAPTIDAIKAVISQGIPVEVGIVVYNDFMNSSTGDWRYNKKTDKKSNIAGGHAIQLTGYTTSGSKTIFTFKNSWGSDWGHAGFGTIDDGVLTNSWGYDPSFDFIVNAAK